MYMLECIYVHHVHTDALGVQKRESDGPDLQLQMSMSV